MVDTYQKRGGLKMATERNPPPVPSPAHPGSAWHGAVLSRPPFPSACLSMSPADSRPPTSFTPPPSRLGTYRRLHRRVGSVLGYFFAIIGLTGILLGWDVHLGGGTPGRPPHGSTPDLGRWQPLATLVEAARATVRDSSGGKLPGEVRRLEARPEQGLVLVQFEGTEWTAQVDGGTGRVLGLEKRRFNLLKSIHEGSIADHLLGTDEVVMKGYTTLMGSALLTLAFTGFWLWWGPRRARR